MSKKIKCILLFTLLSCQSLIVNGANTTPLDQHIYIKPLPNLSLSLDPQVMEDTYSFYISTQIYDTLFQYDEFLSIKPHLLESYQISNDGKKIIFTLKKGVRFHDGKELNADDVVFTVQRLLRISPSRCPELFAIIGSSDFVAGKTKNLSGVKKVSTYSLEIDLSVASPALIFALASPSAGILPANLNNKNGTFFERPIGTGPFKVKKYENNIILNLEANKEYFAVPPKLNEIIYKHATRSEAINGFNKGAYHDLQWYNPRPEELKVSYNVAKFPLPRTAVLLFNMKKRPFDNALARKSFATSINMKKMMEQCFSDKVVANGFIPYGIGGHNKDMGGYSYEPVEARKTISSVFHNTPQQIKVLWMEHHPCSNKFDGIVKKDLENSGFIPDIKYITYPEFLEATNNARNYDVVEIILSIDYPEALSMLNYFKSNYKYNFSGFTNREYDAIIQEASSTIDKYERYKLYDKAQKILYSQYALVNLFYDVESIVYQKYVLGTTVPSIPFSSHQMSSVYLDKSHL